MNLLHLKYAVEVAKTNSISKAAENLYMGQPNLSRAIKELEDSLGIVIFSRTSKGISVTADGEEFLQYATRILSQVDAVEEFYRTEKVNKQKFSACVPRSGYVASAMAEFARSLPTDTPAELFYQETDANCAIRNIMKSEYHVGIIRYQVAFDKYYQNLFDEKNLQHREIANFSCVLLVSKDSPLAERDFVVEEDLVSLMEIAYGDPYVPSLPLTDAKKAELSAYADKHIFVFERGSRFELLEKLPNAFVWTDPICADAISKYGLKRLTYLGPKKQYKDVLIYRKGYHLTQLERRFIEEVEKASASLKKDEPR